MAPSVAPNRPRTLRSGSPAARTVRFSQAGHIPSCRVIVRAFRACGRSLPLAVGRCCCCHRCCQPPAERAAERDWTVRVLAAYLAEVEVFR